jgi:hypothetical protein
MRVLITGPSGIACNLGNRLEIISNITSIQDAHISLGDEVERRPVIPGECLDKFDRIYAVQQTIASWVAPYALGFAYVVGARDDTILCYDDWQAPDAFKLGSADKMIECMWNPKLNRQFQTEGETVRDIINRGIEILCSKNDRKYLLPVLIGGNYELIYCNGKRVPYNPYPFMKQYNYISNLGIRYLKRHRWIMASLQDNSKWIEKNDFKWEVLYYGVRKFGQPRLQEKELARVYAASWGVLYPPHKKLEGSGWWRVRLPMAVCAGSIVYGSTADMSVAFDGHIFERSRIESSSPQELQEIADVQKLHFQKSIWSMDQFLQFIKEL